MNIEIDENVDINSFSSKKPTLTHLSGPDRGQLLHLINQTYHLLVANDQFAIFDSEFIDNHEVLAHLHPSGDAFEIEVIEEQDIRLNGSRIFSALLKNGDIIEIAKPAILLKLGLDANHQGNRINLATLFDDCVIGDLNLGF